uniref:Uncharacterized protein n=1 Tax=Vitis vinifera TaxID=29760 RepID=A5ANH4_VITVI|nr:hypothetical protein VITISV_041445 [Vitis vinifera]
MAHRKETTASRAQGKRPAKPSQPAQMEACRRMRYDTTLFSSVEDYQRVFKDAGVDLSREKDFEVPSIYDTYDEQFLGWMKFEKAPNGSWIRRAEQPLAQTWGQGQVHPGVETEIEIREMGDGLDP